MASETEIGVTGLAELEQKLLQLEKMTAAKAVRGALMTATRPMRDRARALAPVDTGNLVSQIRARSALAGQQRGTAATVHLLVGESGYYGSFIEFGTAKMAARPFLRPAFDETAPQVVERFRASLARRIKRQLVQAKK